MTTFQDGPAKGVTLALKRAPLFLRVVRCGKEWDALDGLEDFPKVEEESFAYKRDGEAATVYINAGRRGSGFYTYAVYGFIEEQPDDATMRDFDKWREWCMITQGHL